MGRLFWKFFLAFWLALLLAGVGVGAAVWLHRSAESGAPGGPASAFSDFDDEDAVFLLDIVENANRYGGLEEVAKVLSAMEDTPLPKIYAVNDAGDELLQRQVAAERLTEARHPHGRHPAAPRDMTTANGEHWLLFVAGHGRPPPHSMPPETQEWDFIRQSDFPQPGGPPGPGGLPGLGPDSGPDRPPGQHRGRPRETPNPLVPIAAGTLASIIFSALLAWYFAKPIRRLKQAFAAVAQGRLHTRVGETMGRRRDELADLGQAFDHMADQLYHLVNAQRRLLHDVSHELRSPLARIQAAIGLAQQQPEKLSAMLSRIERESQRIDVLVGEILALSRLEADSQAMDRQELDIGALLNDIVNDASFEAERYGVRIRYQGLGETPIDACGELLHRAIENVLRNALQYCRQGGEVSLSAAVNPAGQIVIVIEDQGPGVAESELTLIFEAFFRSGRNRKPGRSGTGLGLAIAKRAIEAHGGTITASNRRESGLRVEIMLPTAK